MNNKQRLSLGDISVNFAGIILETLESLGHSSIELAQKFSLNKEFLETPNARISIPKYMRLGCEAIEISGKEDLGLLIGEKTSNTVHGVVGLSAMCASTVGEALDHLIRYEILNSYNSRGRSSFQIENGRAVAQFYSLSPYNKYNFFVVDAMLATLWRFVRTNTDGRPECHHIEIEYERPNYANRVEEHFGCAVQFGAQRNAVVLKRGHHTFPLQSRSATTFKVMSGFCDAAAEKVNSTKRLTDQVIELISQDLTGSPPEIDQIARKLGIAGWTLRRKLNAEGKGYQEILDQTRSALALTYVKDTAHNFTEIAFLLGFSSPSSFQRAFKRWTGKSPGEYRSIKVPDA